MRYLICLITLCCFCFSSVCMAQSPAVQQVSISSNPPGAHITIDGYDCGFTPQAFYLDPAYSHDVVIQKIGYETQTYLLHSETNVKKLAVNALFPVGGTAIGAGVGYVLAGGTTAGLAGVVVGLGACCGLIAGTLVGAGKIGYDVYHDKHHILSQSHIHANLRPCHISIEHCGH